MKEYEAYEVIMKQLCKEMDQIAESIQKTNSMSIQDLERIDKLAHAKKSLLTAKAMEDANGYSDEYNQNGSSGYRGRVMNGRFVSRDSSYDEGYNRGYSEAMNHSGNYYNEPRRW